MVSGQDSVTSIMLTEVRTVPLLFVGVADPVGSGFVTNVARPTGNVTGFANFDPSVGSYWIGLLKEVAPTVEQVGFILDPQSAGN